MLRCTISGLLALMNSETYRFCKSGLFERHASAFAGLIEHKSYYLFRQLPADIAALLLKPSLHQFAARQMKTGLWRGKNPVKQTYDIVSALMHANLWDASLFCSPLAQIAKQTDEYALLLKHQLGAPFTPNDSSALEQLYQTIITLQTADGSFGHTVTGTVIHMRRLLELGIPRHDPAIQNGIRYLLAQRKSSLQGLHTTDTYPLTVSDVFTTENRYLEFQAAQTYRPEWVPRHACFHTMAVIPNTTCINLLLHLGQENNPGVKAALRSLYTLYDQHGGLCATNIKKPYLKA